MDKGDLAEEEKAVTESSVTEDRFKHLTVFNRFLNKFL